MALSEWLSRGDRLTRPHIQQPVTLSHGPRDLVCETKGKRGREMTWQKVEKLG